MQSRQLPRLKRIFKDSKNKIFGEKQYLEKIIRSWRDSNDYYEKIHHLRYLQ